MSEKSTKLYVIKHNVRCLQCGNRGAVQSYGEWCPSGLGDRVTDSSVLEKYRDEPFMNHTMGFGGTIPYECLNCGNRGLIDIDGLEGYRQAFETVDELIYCVQLANDILERFVTTEMELPVTPFRSKSMHSSSSATTKRFQVYEDDKVRIERAKNTKAIEVQIKVPVQNSVIVTDFNGRIVRSHGQRKFFFEHALRILGRN